jgi:SNF2 family DNA or RNA helicase
MRFSTEVLPLLHGQPGVAVEISGEPADYREAGGSLRIGVSTDDMVGETDWFDLGVTITVEGREVPFTDVFRALSANESHLLLADGAYFSLEKPELQALRRLIEEARALQDKPDGPLRISRFQAGLWGELAELGVVDRQAKAWQRQVGGLLAVNSIERTPQPATLAARLRPYQVDGFGWLAFVWEHRLGGVLADDMGLGKTLQSLALICHAKKADPGIAPFLIVAPTSVVANWAAEAARFAPELTVVLIADTLRRRGQDLDEIITGADVAVTSYTLFRLDFEAYSAQDWSGLLLDEAQFVKNHQSKAYQCARRLPAPFKLAITGTPMENNLMELWSMLSITAPGLFPNPTRFRDYYARPIEKGGDGELLGQLRRRIKPLVKRRTKEQVAADLPAKQEQVLEVELHPRHRTIYQRHLQRERQKVLGLIDDIDRNRFTILRSLTLLRQLSLHAGLVDDMHSDMPSIKIDALVEQLLDVTGGGHRALVFSQFTGFLTKVRARLDAEGVDCCYLDGKTRDRAALIKRFKDGAVPVFLISLKAGGFGLNLTEADYCFLLDPWWNPATEAQAVDRAHRIGQTRNVMVYRLIAKDTIEEKVMALKARKAELFSSVMDDGNAFGARLDADDIRGLFA